MRILLVADGRSQNTHGWIRMLLRSGHNVDLVSTFPCAPIEGVNEMRVMPVAFNALSGSQVSTGAHTLQQNSLSRRVVGRFRSLLMSGRFWLGPLSLPFYRSQFENLVCQVKPDLVHGLRIPFEGMLASYAAFEIPLLISIWGNDLTFHAKGSPLMARCTRNTLRSAKGLLADATRDIRLGREWGFNASSPALVVPGGGGVDLQAISKVKKDRQPFKDWLPSDRPLVINPRGFRPGSVRNDTFFQAVPLVLAKKPDVVFACAAMQGQSEAEDWLKKLDITGNVHLLPYLPQSSLWNLFKLADLSISVSEHDGTPNSLLEAMACGCLPIAGDIESIREWITDGKNGLLVDPCDPQALANAILKGLSSAPLRTNAARLNDLSMKKRAETESIRQDVDAFYSQFQNK
jgi:glycosyltransferase involved in cell wall biosynthesis